MNKKALSCVLAACLTTSAILVGCGKSKDTAGTPSEPKKQESKTVVVYSPNQPEINNPIVSDFKAKTGIDVQVITGGTGELLKRVQAEKDNPLGDVFFGGGAESLEAYKDYFEPYKSSEDGNIDAKLKSPQNYWTGFSPLPMVIIYNQKQVLADKAPKSWEDLTNPEWKGKICFADPNKSGSAYTQMITMATTKGGWDLVKQFATNLDGKVEASSGNVPKKVSDGEFPIGITLEESASRFIADGGSLGIVYPSEGTSAVPDGVALIKGSKNSDAAKKFIDYVLGKDVQSKIVNDFKRRSVRGDVQPPTGLKTMKEIPMVDYNFNSAAKDKDANLTKWKDMFIK